MKRLLVLTLVAPAFALAQESNQVSYDYFEIDYTDSNWDFGLVSMDSSGLRGAFSIDFRDQFFVFGDYHTWEFDALGDVGSSSKTFGLGKAFKFGERWSLYAGAGFRKLDLDVGAGNVKDDGGLAMGGARIRFGDNYEFRVGAEYAESSSSGIGSTTVTAGADLHLTDVVALSFDVGATEDDVTSVKVGIRFYPTKDSSVLRRH